MQNHPDMNQMLDALEGFLGEEVAPVAQGPLRFRARVALNLLGILRRELNAQCGDPDEALKLAEAVRSGAADAGEARKEMFALLRRRTMSKLAVDNPAFAARIESEWKGKP